MLLRLVIASILLAVSASAQHVAVESTDRAITISLSRLESIVRYDPADLTRLALAHDHADKPLDTAAIGDVLRWSVIVPDVMQSPVVSIEEQQWRDLPGITSERIGSPLVTMSKAGLVNGIPVSILTIHPWQRHTNGIRVLSQGVVRIRFGNGLLLRSEAPFTVPSYLPALLNGSFRPSARTKPLERPQETVRPDTWLRKDKPYLKVHTNSDGLAALSGKDVLDADSRFRNIAADRLQLWHKGREVPLHIRNASAGMLLADTTQLVFFGRRPYGDSTWFSLWDTTAVFYLTLADTAPSARIAVASSIMAGDTLRYLRMHRHVEYDTGHYHLGDADNADFGVFNSDLVAGEGFYWNALNASAYQRMKHAETVNPVDSMLVDVSFYTVNNSPFDIDHRIDVSVDGNAPVSSYSNGMGRRTATVVLPAGRVATGPSVVKIFATGIDSLRDERTYQSEAVIDYMVYRGHVLPHLDRGRLHGFVPARPSPSAIELVGSRSDSLLVFDRTNNRLLPSVVQTGDLDGSGDIYVGPCVTFRGSITHAEIPWPTLAPDTSVRRVTLMINDTVAVWDTAAKYSFLIGYADGTYARDSTNDPERCVTLLNEALSVSARVMLGLPFGVPDEAVRTRLRTLSGWSGISTLPGIISWADQRVLQGYDQDADGYYTFRSTRPTVNNQDIRYRHLIVLPSDTAEVELFVSDIAALQRPRIERPNLRYYASEAVPRTDIIYITHEEHSEQTERLAAHRRDWNSLSTGIYDVNAIIDEFGAGTHSPFAVKAFLRDIYERAPEPKPRYLVLVGNASWDVRLAIKGGNVGARRPDQIPTYGRPSSDYWYGLIDDEADIRFPELIVGRIPALTRDESRSHVDKIINHDTIPFEPWMRTFFFVGGGTEPEGLCQIYEYMLQDPFATGYNLHDQPFCIDTVTLCAYPPRPNLGYAIRQQLNRGVEWMNFIGHGATDRFDIQGWDPNELDNAGRGGFMATYACQTGAFSNPSTPCKNATYLTEPRNGLAGAIGGTGWAWKYTIDALHYRLHDAMRSHGLRSIGDILYYGKTLLAVGASQDGVNTAMQQTLLGDPLSRVRIDTTTDLYVRRQDVAVTDVTGSTQLTEDDSIVVIRATIKNAGVGTTMPVVVRMRRAYGDVQDTVTTILDAGVCGQSMATCTLSVAQMVGDHRITVEIDPLELVPNDPRPNNSIQFTLGVYSNTLLPVEPQAHWVIAKDHPTIRMIDPNQGDVNASYEFVLSTQPDTVEDHTIVRSQVDDIARSASIIDWNVGVKLADRLPLWLGHKRWVPGIDRVPEFSWLPIITSYTDSVQLGSYDIPARRFSNSDVSIEYDATASALRLTRRDIQVFMRSSGVPTANVLVDPVLEIVIGSIPYVNNPYYRGMNVVVLGPNDTIPKAIRRYDTWRDPLTVEEGGHNGFAREFLQFMTDSIADDDRVFVAICNEAITGFVKDTLLDSLHRVMRSFGSAAIDSLEPRASWVFYGRRGLMPGAAREVFENVPDSMVTMQFTIPYAASSGTVRSPRLGPAKRWKNLQVHSSGDPNSVRSIIVGVADDGVETNLDTLHGADDPWSPVDGASLYGSMYVVTEMSDADPNDSADPTLYGVTARYDPADELLIEKTGLTIDPVETLRGDTIEIQATVRNAYRSQAAMPKAGDVAARAENTTERILVLPWSIDTAVPPDAATVVKLRMPTSRLASTNVMDVRIDPTAVDRDLYRYNNAAATLFTVRDDSVPPQIVAFVDGQVGTDGMYTVMDPMITIVVLDNSKLPISDSTRLTVFVNGDRIRPANTTDYAFYSTETIAAVTSDVNARAGLSFRYLMEQGQNNLIVRALDATGNGDTLELRLFTSDKLLFNDVSVAPHPVSTTASFLVDLVADRRDIDGQLEIYGLRGERMRTLQTTLQLGRSVIPWDGRDDTGAIVPVGVYHARFIANDPAGPVTKVLQFVVLR